MKPTCLLIALLFTSVAHAASFNCSKAQSADEKAVCANKTLNDLDVQMATKFDFLLHLFAMGGQGSMRDAQHDWLNTRKACGADKHCLLTAYQKRIAQLDAIYDTIDKPVALK